MNRIRPELIKDNPVAPQPYVSPRRKRTPSRAASSTRATAQERLKETLQTLTGSAERFVNSLPQSKKTSNELNALLNAIAQAQRLLSAGHPSEE